VFLVTDKPGVLWLSNQYHRVNAEYSSAAVVCLSAAAIRRISLRILPSDWIPRCVPQKLGTRPIVFSWLQNVERILRAERFSSILALIDTHGASLLAAWLGRIVASSDEVIGGGNSRDCYALGESGSLPPSLTLPANCRSPNVLSKATSYLLALTKSLPLLSKSDLSVCAS
jgi:hypothetical protein